MHWSTDVIAVDAVLFDLDGTLIDSKQDIANAVHFLQKKHRRPLSSDGEIARFIGDGAAKLVERAIGRGSAARLAEALTEFKAHYRAHALDHTDVYSGVREMLQHFRRKKMAVITNKPVRISRFILGQLGLLDYFPVVIGGDSGPLKKPHPDGIFCAMDLLQVHTPRRILMVGDSAQDVLAGRAAGVKTCGILSNIGDPQQLCRTRPDFTILSMPNLLRIIS